MGKPKKPGSTSGVRVLSKSKDTTEVMLDAASDDTRPYCVKWSFRARRSRSRDAPKLARMR
jgi:hypothetical protein